MKGEVGIEELVAISVGDIPSSNVPEMSKTPLKQNHSEQAFSFSVLYALKASIQIKIKIKGTGQVAPGTACRAHNITQSLT